MITPLRMPIANSRIPRDAEAPRFHAVARTFSPWRWLVGCLFLLAIVSGSLSHREAIAQAPDAMAPDGMPQAVDDKGGTRRGVILPVPLPLNDAAVQSLRTQLVSIADASQNDAARPVVVLRFGQSDGVPVGGGTPFEQSLALTRLLVGPSMQKVALVAYLEGPVEGHAVLPVLACEQWIVGQGSSLGNAARDELELDPSLVTFYQSITQRRRTMPDAAVVAILDRQSAIIRVELADGSQRFVTVAEAEELRQSGKVIREDACSLPGELATFSADQLRQNRWATHLIANSGELANALDLADLEEIASGTIRQPVGGMIEIASSFQIGDLTRVQRQIDDATSRQGVNELLIVVDASEVDPEAALQLAESIAAIEPSRVRVTVFVRGQAPHALSLLAASGTSLYVHPDAVLGGNRPEGWMPIENGASRIEAIAVRRQRNANLLLGLCDSDEPMYRWTNRRTGRVAYATAAQLEKDGGPQAWEQHEAIELRDGISGTNAVQYGLASAAINSPLDAAVRMGLPSLPPPIADRWIVAQIERLASSWMLMNLLLFVGFFALSVEMGSPGVGVPGFIAFVCFGLFFWASFLSGTAELLEILLFVMGVACILFELFVLPGFGIFGIGGLVMILSSLILASQTFVIPRSEEQLVKLTQSVGGVVIGFVGIGCGLFALRTFFHRIPILRELASQPKSAEELAAIEDREKLVHFDHYLGQRGRTLTILRPSGKARIGDDVVAVVTAGEMLEEGESIVVAQVQGNRIIVERSRR
jgi:membrane-bound serine protease (ClpP class)